MGGKVFLPPPSDRGVVFLTSKPTTQKFNPQVFYTWRVRWQPPLPFFYGSFSRSHAKELRVFKDNSFYGKTNDSYSHVIKINVAHVQLCKTELTPLHSCMASNGFLC